MAKQFFVHIMASRRNGTLYIGVISNLVQRVWNHKQGLAEGFTSKYSVKMLVYFEPHETAESAITREKQLKKWERAWKMRLRSVQHDLHLDWIPASAGMTPPGPL
ncbi:MAG: GIY-YIG nuclease family protein [Syntrophobacteraceae bacterium]